MTEQTCVIDTPAETLDPKYLQCRHGVTDYFTSLLGNNKRSGVFRVTPKTDIFEHYLSFYPETIRQTYNCNTCRRFFEKYGTMVLIEPDGLLKSLVFDPATELGSHMAEFVQAQFVTSIFFDTGKTYGVAQNTAKDGHVYEHFYVSAFAPEHLVAAENDTEKGRMRAVVAKENIWKEKFDYVSQLLKDYPLELLERAVGYTETELFHRPEIFAGIVRIVRDLSQRTSATLNNKVRNNLIWEFVGRHFAPGIDHTSEAIFHINGSTGGNYLELLAKGREISEVAAIINSATGYKYMRATEMVNENQINEAESIVREQGLLGSLRRRCASIEDLHPDYFLWKPAQEAEEDLQGNLFDKVRAKAGVATKKVESERLPGAVVMDFERFSKDVLPKAQSIKVRFPEGAPLMPGFGGHHQSYMGQRRLLIAFSTAVEADAPPILAHDVPGDRNPVSYYTYKDGVYLRDFGLNDGGVYECTGVINPDFRGPLQHPVFLIKGAGDKKSPGAGIFSEDLKSDLRNNRAFRSFIETYSNMTKLEPGVGEPAAGVAVNSRVPTIVEVNDGKFIRTYKIDRVK